MGITSGRIVYGTEADYQAARDRGDLRSQILCEGGVETVVRGPREQTRIPIGTRFGELTVIGYLRKKTNSGRSWGWNPLCVCNACGEETSPLPYNLKKGRTTRCNKCAKQKSSATRKMYWGYADILPDDEHRSRLLNRIASAYQRCQNPKAKAFAWYGARGIEVRFKDRRDFLSHLISLDGWDDPSREIDRINTDGHYEAGNLRFATKSENLGNKRTILEMQKRIEELETRLRHSERGSA